MKNLLFRLYLELMKLGARFTKINDNDVVVLNGAGHSGSNGYLFAKYLKNKHPEYNVTVVEPWPSAHLSLKTWRKIGAAKFILTTHQPFKIRSRQVNIQFWHGIPLKRMGIMANNTTVKTDQRNAKLWQKNADVVCSNSDLYETLMSACCAIETDKYQRVGFPRLDFLQKPAVTKQQLLKDLFGHEDEQAQVGMYMPTFRYEMEDQTIIEEIKAGNFMALADFDGEKLDHALKMHHQYLIVKLHPYEMRQVGQLAGTYSNITFLNDSYLTKQDLDLYELLGDTDFLITDFSSIYFDYLNLDRPLIFLTNHLKQYEKTRGLLIGPYKKVVPGACANSQNELLAVLSTPDHYQKARHYWHDLTSQVDLGKACANVVSLMKKY